MTVTGTDWTAPGLYDVAPGVYRIPLPLPNDGLRAVNVYAIVDGETLVCIDAGWALTEARVLFAQALESLGCGFGDITRFLVTHVHRDHYTQAVALRRDFATPVSLGIGERPTLEHIQDPRRKPLEAQMHQLRLHGAADLADQITAAMSGDHESDRSVWGTPDDWLAEGELTLSSGRQLSIVETPGHTAGHVVFHDPVARLLFAGDHVLPTITPSIGFESVPSPSPLADFLGSLARVRQMPDALLLPAHGLVAPSVHARIDELIDHHGRRLDDTEAAVVAGAYTAYDVATRLSWTRRARRLTELDEFNQMLAITETGAHLTLLVSQGRVTRALADHVYHYGPLP